MDFLKVATRRIRHRLKKSPALTLPQVALLLKAVLLARMFRQKYVLDIVRKTGHFYAA
jgi:hypothetical protein